MREVVWTLRATIDLQSIYDTLEDRQPGAGERFALEIAEGMERLRQHPHLSPPFEPPARRLLVWRCRYGVIYVPEARGIVVLAVTKLAQDTDILRREIRKLLDFPKRS